jgi:hypothetical protein
MDYPKKRGKKEMTGDDIQTKVKKETLPFVMHLAEY